VAKHVLILDGDSEVYAAAAAAEKRRVVALAEYEDLPPQLIGPFDKVKDCTEALPERAKATLFRSLEIATEEGAQLLLDARLRRVIAQAEERYGSMDLEIYLSGKINYRHLLDHTYKGNRDATQKPHWHGRLRNYVQDKYGARVTKTWEADDEVGIRATELGARAVIASVDKDLRQIPGHHIVLGKGHLHVTERGALMRLYIQILAGDSTDNVRGCWQVGPEGAFNYLNACLQEDGESDTRQLSLPAMEACLWRSVVAKYQQTLEKYGTDKCRFIDARGAALHTAQMVYLLRERPEGQLPPRWLPPDARP
jgi:hypothetical protein